MTPIDAFKQHRQLRTRQTDGSFSSLRPDESAPLQTLGEQTQAIAIEPQNFYDVATAASEYEYVTGERLLVEHGLYLRARPSKPRRMSVTPAASQILVPLRSSITCAGSEGSNATASHQRRSQR
jgi:hypothetical protein